MIYAIFFISGLVLGLGMHILLRVFTPVDGVFVIDDGDPETTRWTLQMRSDPHKISEKKYVIMKVDTGGK